MAEHHGQAPFRRAVLAIYVVFVTLWIVVGAAFAAAISAWELSLLLVFGGVVLTVAWLILSISRRRWTVAISWPLAVGLVALLVASQLPLVVRLKMGEHALSEFVQRARTGDAVPGWASTVRVLGYQSHKGCVFLETGKSSDGVAGLVWVPAGESPPEVLPTWAFVDYRHVTGRWWQYETHT